MSIKNLEIKPSEAKTVEVASLPTRPTSSATYGGRGLTAQQMKAAYDAYPALIKERFNALIADLLSGSALADIPFSIPDHAPLKGTNANVLAFLTAVGDIIDFGKDKDGNDATDRTIIDFANTVIHDMAVATDLAYDKSTRQLTLTIDGEQKSVIIEVDKYEKAIQQLNEQVASLEARKFDKAGGGISGDVNIGGNVFIGKDLTVAGNSTIQEAGHLKIKDAVIITNSDGEKLAVLSGLAIRKGENDSGVDETYGIMYDFASNSVKLGLIYTDENGNYQFLAEEGQPVATRADSAELAEHGIALWDAANHRFIAKDMTDLDLTYGNTTVNYDTVNGMTINGQARFTYDGGTTKDVPMNIDVPVVAGEGITIDKVNGQEKVEVKLDTDYTDGKYVAKQTNITYKCLYAVDNKKDIFIPCSVYAELIEGQWTIAQRYQNGRLRVGTAVEDSDAMPKKQVEDGFLAKQEGIVGQTRVYTVRRDNNGSYQDTAFVDANYTEWSVALRAPGGVLRVGTPVGVNDATTKAYVDGLHHYSHHIVISNGTSEIFITLAIKNHPNAVTTLDGVTELVFDLTEGGMQPIMATGVVYGHNVHAVLVQADRHLYANYYDSTKNMIMTDKVQVLFNDTATVHDMVV